MFGRSLSSKLCLVLISATLYTMSLSYDMEMGECSLDMTAGRTRAAIIMTPVGLSWRRRTSLSRIVEYITA